jgi:DNA phosphorothioation-dependent restriction protein DptG
MLPYFCQCAERFTQLYTFLYCTQLALNINRFDGNTPLSQPVYFILDTEKASSERSKIRNSSTSGYQAIEKSVEKLFPNLAILEHFNRHIDDKLPRQPLWRYIAALLSEDPQLSHLQEKSRSVLKDFSNAFKSKKLIPNIAEATGDPKTKDLRQLIKYACAQFDENATKKDTKIINLNYIKAYNNIIAKHFVQSRGRMGRVLVLNQDFMLILTNICIGEREQLRFQDLLFELQKRGIYFDRQSEQTLIGFYERIGNVARMSDSGDAVYVKRTI